MVQDDRHINSITHMPCDLVGDINVLQSGNILHGPKSGNRVETARGRTEQVVQDPVVAGITVHKSPRHRAANFVPRPFGRCYACSEEEHVLHDPVRLLFGQFVESVEDDSGAEGEANESDRSDTKMAINQDVRKDFACCESTVEGIGPGVVNEISQLGQNYASSLFSIPCWIGVKSRNLLNGHWIALISAVITVADKTVVVT